MTILMTLLLAAAPFSSVEYDAQVVKEGAGVIHDCNVGTG